VIYASKTFQSIVVLPQSFGALCMVSMGYSEEEIKTLSRRWQVCKRRRKHAFGFFDQTG
jgi:hypothetical protein